MVGNSMNVLGRHLRKEHKIEYKDYLIKHFHGGMHPLCKCGCNKEVTFAKGGFRAYAEKGCRSRTDNHMTGKKGKDNPNTGKVRTEEHKKNYSKASFKRWEDNREKLVELAGTPEKRKKLSEAGKKSFAETNRAERVSVSLKEWWVDSPNANNARNVKRELAIRLGEEGKFGIDAQFEQKWFFNPFNQKEEFLNSSWERIFLEYCILNNLPFIKSHSIRISYLDENKTNRIYIPDFYFEHCNRN